MGDFAYYCGERIKIGTCGNLTDLRWDQRAKVHMSEVSLFNPNVLARIDFRFPWPDEDNIAPGHFENVFRGLRLWGFEQPTDVDHSWTQFRADNGYLLSLPCPESNPAIVANGSKPAAIHKNGYGGPAELVAQAWRDGRLVGIVRCKGCRAPYRLEGGYQEAAALSIRAEADREIRTADMNHTEGNRRSGMQLHEIADRLLAGYRLTSYH